MSTDSAVRIASEELDRELKAVAAEPKIIQNSTTDPESIFFLE